MIKEQSLRTDELNLAHWGIILILVFGLPNLVLAESSGEILNQIQLAFDQFTELHATISQTNTDPSSKTATTYTGEVYFQKPAQLRIDYSQPSEQRFVFDGKFLWLYTAELKQVTKQKLESCAISVPLLFFAGASNLDQQEFRKKNWISPVKRETIGSISTYRIRIRPKSKSAQVAEQSFWVNAETFLPVKARIIEPTGIIVTVTFADVETDCGFPSETFSMPIPAGVEFVDLTTPSK
ncbi:MAG: outer membrane lipoprotein chaperone LolA [bacterium]|nr:outer membrane lipoprotein chaperone LolA [bacterium]